LLIPFKKIQAGWNDRQLKFKVDLEMVYKVKGSQKIMIRKRDGYWRAAQKRLKRS